jgi:hypothetical protein
MRGGWLLAIGLVALLMPRWSVLAHNEYRIIGVIQKVSPKSLSVRQNKDGKVITMEMDAESIVTRDKKKVPQSELKIGLNVVVDACGDSIDKLLVMEVRLVPPPRSREPGAGPPSLGVTNWPSFGASAIAALGAAKAENREFRE